MIRKGIALLLTALLLFLLASCSFGFSTEEDDTSTTEDYTIISHTKAATLHDLAGEIKWKDNAICAVEYLGTKETYNKKLHTLKQGVFSNVPESVFDTLSQNDLGGDGVFLVVPRFNTEVIDVFSIYYKNNRPQILRQDGARYEPFLLICNNTGDANAQLKFTLTDVNRTFSFIPKLNEKTGAVVYSSGFQAIEKA